MTSGGFSPTPALPILDPSRCMSLTTSSSNGWLAEMLLTAKTIAAGAECVPIPCVRAAFGLLVIFLETVNTMQRNREDLKDLCGNAVEIVTILQGEMSAHGETALPRLFGLVENFISLTLRNLQASAIAEDIVRYKIRIQELRSNLLLMTAINTNLNIVGIHKIVTASRSSPSTPGFRDVAVGDINLLYQTAMRSETHKVKIFIARISGEPSPMTVAQYEDDMEGWKNAFHLYSSFRHPNVWQLFGVSTAPTLRALIFHDGIAEVLVKPLLTLLNRAHTSIYLPTNLPTKVPT
ncbi:hypothetical protein B0H14DRAFT_2883501 [Mycena olivaceomarginata]|nr:hypothetical protein B0H14DRAFT_2883501 [Mycena olivaceomarginata]